MHTYWGYDHFRPLQEDIIQSIGSGRDTLGLMPTGGGKSLTFQVPTLAANGLCLVITPLISLMKDQVLNLREKGIKAEAIYTGLEQQEINLILDNCTFGEDYKFLYVSPERLASREFVRRLVSLPVCLIAVDEAHCISQWGYDFRPAYLKIGEIRSLLPDIPILALTATATPDVIEDIQDKLLFREHNVLRKSFFRENLSYVVRKTDDKPKMLLRILDGVPGSSVVYVRNRQKTKEIADFLNSNGITADYYHAGLSNADKDARQQSWRDDRTRVIVATNAFGMGIDKPDVRSVIHIDLPDCIEAYFQEAGRAGRDGKRAWCVLLYNKTDRQKLNKRIVDNYPDPEFVIRVYDTICNYYEIGAGSGMGHSFAFVLEEFCRETHLPMLPVFSAIMLLQQAGYIAYTDAHDTQPQVQFLVTRSQLDEAIRGRAEQHLVQELMRTYTGIFTDTAYIRDERFAKTLGISTRQLNEQLVGLARQGIVRYIPRRHTPYITFIQERELTERIVLTKSIYEERKDRYVSRLRSMLEYAENDTYCRSQILLDYFGESNSAPCGKCDVCLTRDN